MGCNATFAIAANEENMTKLAHAIATDIIKDARDQKNLLAKDLKTEAEANRLKMFYPYSLYPQHYMEALGSTYLTYFTIRDKTSSAAIGYFNELVSRLPEGKYGIAFSFAWDFEPEAVAINGPDELYPGDGQDISSELNDLSEDYFWTSTDRTGQLKRKGLRLKDMVDNTDYVTVAQAISLRLSSPERD